MDKAPRSTSDGRTSSSRPRNSSQSSVASGSRTRNTRSHSLNETVPREMFHEFPGEFIPRNDQQFDDPQPQPLSPFHDMYPFQLPPPVPFSTYPHPEPERAVREHRTPPNLFPWPLPQNYDHVPQQFMDSSSVQHNPMGAAEQVHGNFGYDDQGRRVTGNIIDMTSQHRASRIAAPPPPVVEARPSRGRRSSHASTTATASTSATGSTSTEVGGQPDDSYEEKRRRNTVASARFRIKKKQRTHNLEHAVADLTGRASELEREATELRRENTWLKEIVMLKGKNNLARNNQQAQAASEGEAGPSSVRKGKKKKKEKPKSETSQSGDEPEDSDFSEN